MTFASAAVRSHACHIKRQLAQEIKTLQRVTMQPNFAAIIETPGIDLAIRA